jgi:hypothetical protein
LRGEVVRSLILLVLVGGFVSPSPATVSVSIYASDEETPLPLADPNNPGVYRDIMVGTRLAVFINSDTAGIWDGQLWMSPEAAAVGALSGRGYDPKSPTRNHKGSCLKAAGRNPLVSIHSGPDGVYVSLLSAWDALAGEWFVLDYRAKAVGTCHIELYDLRPTGGNPNPYIDDPPSFELDLIETLMFNHVPTRDFDGSGAVDFVDLALLAAHLGTSSGADPNEISPFDLNVDGWIDTFDVAAFSEFWLERTDLSGPVTGPEQE